MNSVRRFFCTTAWGLILTGALSACGGGGSGGSGGTPAVASPDFQAAVLKSGAWVIMGSSTAAGAGASPGKSWVELLQSGVKNQAIPFVNIAKGGTATYHGLSAAAIPQSGRPLPDPTANIDQALSRHSAFLILAYPTNDTALGYSVDETVNNLLSIRHQALANSVPVMLLSTQPRNLPSAQLALLPLIDERLAAIAGPCFVEVRTGLATANGQLVARYDAGDGVHPNDEGHQLIAARVQAVLDAGRCVQISPL